MPLTPGTKLGPYQILGPLGRGGMGEVYRATDTRLGREVAVKVLPAHTAADAEHRARLEREARAIAALSHPHICTLHDIGRAGETDYIVMELVHGETLSARLGRGPLPLEDLLQCGAEIAEALQVAHRAGVLHRDLKPSNVMLGKSGAKLMDFGLARSASRVVVGDQTHAPTESAPITGDGRIVGTVHYMAPEQLEGHPADMRSDIWALGVTLYEMATAQHPFERSSGASLISAILRDEPRSLVERAPLTPPALDRLVRRCLTKDPDKRWQSAGDLAHELRWIAGKGVADVQMPAEREGGPRLGLTLSRRAAVALMACIAILLTAGAGLIWQRVTAEPQRIVRTSVLVPGPVVRMITRESFSISPDGQTMLFVLPDSTGESRLYVRNVADETAVPIGEAGASAPFWSPDSRQIAYTTAEGRLVKISVTGGASQTLCKAPNLTSGAWSRNRWLVFSMGSGPLMRVRDTGGEPESATVLDSARHETQHQYPQLLPDGRHFMYMTDPPLGPSRFRVKVGSTGGGAGKDLMVVHHAPVSDGDEWIVFMRDRALLAQRIARDGSRLIGEPVAMEEVPDRRGSVADPIVKVGGGTLVYSPLDSRPVEIAWYSRQGLKLGRVGGEPYIIAPEVSRDGKHAVMRGVQGGETWLVGLDLTTGAVNRLTSMEDWNSWPIWDAAAREILYAAAASDGGTSVRAMQLDLPDAPRAVAQRSYYIRPEFDAGSAGLVVNQTSPKGGSDIALLDHHSGEVIRTLAGTPADEIGGVVFAGGRALAYASNSSGRYELYATDFTSPGRPARLTSHGCSPSLRMFRRPVWAVGDELIYCSADGQTVRSLRVTLDGGQWRASEDRALFALPQGLRGLCPSPDGSRFLLLTTDGNQSLPTVTLVQGWHRELRKH